jgi:predicted enzyme related to lactoylglutathione lyase
MPSELAYFTIPVADMRRGRAFWGELFGWEFAPDANDRYAHVANTRLPGGLNAPGEGSSPNVWFRVADIQAAVKRVVELGGEAEKPAQSPSGWSCACRDDQGTRFNLWQPAPGYAGD